MKPLLIYLRPKLEEVPERFHGFLLHSTQCWLDEYFETRTLELSSGDQRETIIPSGTQIILLQVIPELGFEHYKYSFNHKGIPLVVYLSVDSISPSRYAAFNFAEGLNADAYFVNDLSMGLRYPAFRDKLFYLPWFIPSSDLSSAEDVKKDVFMLLVGHNRGTYPWRNRLFPRLKTIYNTEQLAYFSKFGKAYLRELAKAKYIPTDGGFGRIIVNKHFEIPASCSCLITQPTEAVLAAGFKDMVNCIMAENFDEIVEKVTACEESPVLYSSIVKNGYDLVVNRHTEKSRPQLFEWYVLNKEKTNAKKIIQPDPFDHLKLEGSLSVKRFDIGFTDDNVITKEIDDLIRLGNYEIAYNKCEFLINEYLEYSPDFLVRKAIVCIHRKKFQEAVKSLWRLMNFELYLAKGMKPEPVEWSLLLLSLYLANRRNAIRAMLDMFEYESEPFYNYVKFLILSGPSNNNTGSCYYKQSLKYSGQSRSAHTLVPSKLYDIEKWIEDLAGKQGAPDDCPRAFSNKRNLVRTSFYKYFLIEYHCLLYAEGNSLRNNLKCRARLIRSLSKFVNKRRLSV